MIDHVITRARFSGFLSNAAVILQAPSRSHLPQFGPLSDSEEQGPPADHAGYTARERKKAVRSHWDLEVICYCSAT